MKNTDLKKKFVFIFFVRHLLAFFIRAPLPQRLLLYTTKLNFSVGNGKKIVDPFLEMVNSNIMLQGRKVGEGNIFYTIGAMAEKLNEVKSTFLQCSIQYFSLDSGACEIDYFKSSDAQLHLK